MILIFIGVVKVVVLVLLEFKGKLNGGVVCVLIVNVFLVDLVVEFDKEVIVEEVNVVFKVVVEGELKGIFGYSEELLVFIDYNGCIVFFIIDVLFIMVMEGNMVKVFFWYDNEIGYFNCVVDLVVYMILKGF